MGSSDLGAPTAIQQLQSRQRTTLIVGTENNPSENAISDDPRGDEGHTLPHLFECEGRLLLNKTGISDSLVFSRQHSMSFVQAEAEDTIKISR
ncbi:hypothetical protein EKPJFOCH_1333 [Methylobacterium thuringiense]|uniref:Uncharacterized protein n=1 Tax=Methylobacterium thuringiense TaxID=1003091 RepID=A0ABQ4TLZ8_9HYPH|nr:hypothetical protein EKPJFOCH_1333 [Methylobacterium thuringiense]